MKSLSRPFHASSLSKRRPKAVYNCPIPFTLDSFRHDFYLHVSSILFSTASSVPFSSAAATRSLSFSCFVTCVPVLWLPSLIRTSTRKRAGSARSSRTRTPSPITVARLQCVMVGVTITVTVLMPPARARLISMSGSDTTASEPRLSGCSGSEMVEMRSVVFSSVGHVHVFYRERGDVPKISCSSISSTSPSSASFESPSDSDIWPCGIGVKGSAG